jgi:hypothetical protein
VNTDPGILFTTLYFHHNFEQTQCVRVFETGKPFQPTLMLHFSLMGRFVSYIENKVLQIQTLRLYLQHFIFITTYLMNRPNKLELLILGGIYGLV